MTARDLFQEIPQAAEPDAEAQVQHRQLTGQTPGPEARERLPLPGVSVGPTCGTCGEWSESPTGFGFCEHLPRWQTTSPRARCTFAPAKWKVIDTATLARRDAQKGIDVAAAAADRKHRGWTAEAFEFIKTYAKNMKGKQFIGHDIVAASCVRGILQPENSKAWGQPIQRAAREGLIKRVGFAPDPNRHTNPVPLWESA